ncbi:VWA domain-containing protein [Polyangium aurulentum]|uniref:VWA domain-containing protein n=1 Tax=Polyangium aurulentum TaxID=2567896 RepID=UPI0010AEB0BE|nr:VWA domain-containing protein [Polyangium aurulentum]UQA60312.1 VWA domain-containing protein [Polyangium aurulentum]
MRTWIKAPLGCALASATLAAALLSPATAAADEVRGTRSDKLVEKAHVIDVRMGRGHADLVVRRTVHNGGPRQDQATFLIGIPLNAVATGLRTLGMLGGKTHWFEGELMAAQAAADKYRELTGVGSVYPKDPALLSWRSQTELDLRVFPCAPGEDKTVEYTLRMPTRYHDGRYHLELPALGTEALPAAATVSPLTPGATLFRDDKPIPAGAHIALKSGIDLSVAIPQAPPFDAALAAVPFGSGKNVVHFRFDAGPQISTVPAGAHVVLLLDSSRSLSEDPAIQTAMARAYLSHFKDARVEIVTFDRKVRPLHGRFVPVTQAMAELRQLSFERKNGSNIDEALARADALLAALPAGTPKRILALTDTRTRAELQPEVLRTKLQKSGALLHVGVVSEGSTELSRDDEHAWAKLTRPTGGLVWHAGINLADPDQDKRRVYEEWARPVRIDKFAVRAEGVDYPKYAEPLDEGQGIEDLRITTTPVTSIEVTGELWATPLRKVAVPDQAEGKRWAAFTFGSHLLHEISEEEMMPLAMLGRAVSPVTSYLAVEPGVRPSTDGLEDFGMGFGGIGDGGGGSTNCGGLALIRMKLDKQAYLRNALANGLAACGGTGRRAEVRLETTLREIVRVKATLEGATSTDDKLSSCLEESAWALELPHAFDVEWEEQSVSL